MSRIAQKLVSCVVVVVGIGTASFAQNLIRYEKKGKIGWKEGKKVVIEAQYDEASSTSFVGSTSSHGNVKLNGKWGKIDRSGSIIIPFEYDEIGNIYGNATLVEKAGKKGLIDNTGKELTPIKYTFMQTTPVGDFFRVQEDGKMGLIDYTGKVIIPSKYDKIHQSGYSPNNVGQFNCTTGGETEVFNEKGELLKDAKPVVRQDTYSTGSSSSGTKTETKKETQTQSSFKCSKCGNVTSHTGSGTPSGGKCPSHVRGSGNGTSHTWKRQ